MTRATLLVAPLLACYRWRTPPTAMSFGELIPPVIAGILLWLTTLFAIRHPIVPDIRHLAGAAVGRALRRPAREG